MEHHVVPIIGPNGKATASAEEAFDFIGVGRSSGYERIRDGTIPAVKFGRLKRVSWAWLYRKTGII